MKTKLFKVRCVSLTFYKGLNIHDMYDIYDMIQTYSRFVVSHRPYEGLKLRAGFHTGDVIAGVQVQDALSLPPKLSFVNK